jgi:hypothetical protein
MKDANEMGSCSMIYTSSFIKIRSGNQMLMGKYIDTHTQRQHGDHVRFFFSFDGCILLC